MRYNRVPRLIGITCVALAALLGAGATLAQEAAHDPDPARFEADIRAFEAWDRQNAFPKDAVLFVGSSSIRVWQTAESFPDFAVINRGFGGSHTSDVNHFADRIVLKYSPRVIVFYAGDNDIADGKSAEKVAGDFRRFVECVHGRLPETHIIYLPIKPSLARWPMWPRMREANDLIREFIGSNERLTYVDTATPMLSDDGQPRRELFLDDGLHMNAAGHQLWTQILRAELAPP